MRQPTSLSGTRVLVTGSSGVIGSELLERLIRRGAQVLSVDRYPSQLAGRAGAIHLQRDMTAAPLYELFDFKPRVIFHLAAAFERSRESREFWRVNWHDNVVLSHSLLDIVRELHSLETFVFASSYLIYDPSLYLSSTPPEEPRLLGEADPAAPRNITGASKLYTEQEVNFIKELWNPSLRVVNARIYRVYGRGSEDVISRWVRSALSGEEIRLYNRENAFDFVFAADVAEGLARLAESERAEGIVNLGSGNARRVKDILSILGRMVPELAPRIRDLGVTEEFEASCANIDRLRQLTRWLPPTTLEEGIDKILRFERERHAARA